jgi:hypothetical protein
MSDFGALWQLQFRSGHPVGGSLLFFFGESSDCSVLQ